MGLCVPSLSLCPKSANHATVLQTPASWGLLLSVWKHFSNSSLPVFTIGRVFISVFALLLFSSCPNTSRDREQIAFPLPLTCLNPATCIRATKGKIQSPALDLLHPVNVLLRCSGSFSYHVEQTLRRTAPERPSLQAYKLSDIQCGNNWGRLQELTLWSTEQLRKNGCNDACWDSKFQGAVLSLQSLMSISPTLM